MLLEKLPEPVPSFDLLSAIIGLVPVLQQTPRAITGELPSSVISPPLVALLPEIFEIEIVVTSGAFSFLHPVKTVTTMIIAIGSLFLIRESIY